MNKLPTYWMQFSLKPEVMRTMNRAQYKAAQRYLRICRRVVHNYMKANDAEVRKATAQLVATGQVTIHHTIEKMKVL